MINLMPDETKRQIRAARMNVILMRYIIILLFAIGFLALISVGAHILLSNIKDNAQAIIDTNQIKADAYGSVQAEADTLRSDLALAKAVFDQEINYPKILTTIGSLTPSGVVLDKLSLSPSSFGTPITIQAYAKTTDEATALKTNFEKSPLFSVVTMQSLSTKNGLTDYPVNAMLSVTMNKDGVK